MSGLSGKRVLVTGASGLVAFPVAVELAKNNEVFAVARYSDPKQQKMIEAAGARAIAFDVAQEDLSALPKSVDVVINYAVLPMKSTPARPAGWRDAIAIAKRSCTAAPDRSTNIKASARCARTIPTVYTPLGRIMRRARSRRNICSSI
jgi:nucleoside-diphosphate-sugar epimerase